MRAAVEIDVGAIAANVAGLRGRLQPGTKLAAVVKGDGYGHGLVETARAVLAGGADWLAVALIEEGLALRAAGVRAPVLVMGYVPPGCWEAAVRADLAVAVFDAAGIKEVAAAARKVGNRARVHLKVDTGLHRFGVAPDEALGLLELAFRYPELQVEGLFSHFAAAYNPDKTEARAQFELFRRACEAVSRAGYHIPLKHIANSAAYLHMPETHLDMVRVGRLIYGVCAHPGDRELLPLRPPLRWVSRVVLVRDIPAGERVGYYPVPRLSRACRVGIVPVGYADGLPETLAGRGWLLVRGKRAPILAVCMDVTFIDVSSVPGVTPGDEAVVIGSQAAGAAVAGTRTGEAAQTGFAPPSGDGETRAEDLAGLLGVCPVSLFTGITRRVPRLYRCHGRDALWGGENW